MSINGWTPNGGNNQFFVFTGYNVYSCTSAAKTSCSFTQYCAYHSSFTSSGQTVVYANMPDDGTLLNGCGIGKSPNGDIFADSVISVTSHEQFEAFNDPTGTGWFYLDGAHEIGDECNGIFGIANNSTLIIGSNRYRLQEEWSNSVHGCESFAPDFGITLNLPPTVTIVQGSGGLLHGVLEGVNGFAGDVLFSGGVQGNPPQTLGALTASAGVAIDFTLGISATSSQPPGVFPWVFTGTSQSQINPGDVSSVTFLVTFVTPEQAPVVAVIQGADGNVYWNLYSSQTFPSGTWSGWQSLSMPALSSPTLCKSGLSRAEVVVRSTGNTIMHRSFSEGVWAPQWDSPGGTTTSQPACAVLGNTMYLAVVGSDSAIYINSLSLLTGAWSGWTGLGGMVTSAPTLVASPAPGPNRLDLVVEGGGNSIWHRAFVSGVWQAWDSPGGSTAQTPAIATTGSALQLVVVGSDSSIYSNQLTFGGSWSTWQNLGGSSHSAPSLAVDSTGTTHLIVIGLDGSIYHKVKPLGGTWASTWDSPGGSVSSPAAVTALGSDIVLLVRGTDSQVYFNELALPGWVGWTGLGGTTNVSPAVTGAP
jgi:hypothetical protein